MKRINGWGAFFCLGALLASPARAQILGTSARQMAPGSLKLLAYYQGTQDQDLTFSLAGRGSCASANGVSFSCSQTGDVEAEGSGGAGFVKLIYQPWDSFQYYGAIGVGEYSMRVPSATVVNTLSGDDPGMTYTAGMKVSVWPDTEFGPGIALDGSVSRSRYKFNRRFPGGTPGQNNNINQALDLWQYQFAVEASHVFTIVEKDKLVTMKSGVKLEPYGGVKWTRTHAKLKDLQDGSSAGGKQDTISPFLGLKVPVFEHEGFFAEASFVNGYQYAAGLEVRFK